MDGIPERVSLVILISFTIFPSLLYWVRKIAAPRPRGTAIKRENTTINMVFMMEGSMETLSEVYFHWKSDNLSCGIPRIIT